MNINSVTFVHVKNISYMQTEVIFYNYQNVYLKSLIIILFDIQT